jgi:hypothetical protein
VGVGLALAGTVFAMVRKAVTPPKVTTKVEEEAYDYAAVLNEATKQAREAVLFSNEDAAVVHDRVYWMIEQWAAIYNRLQMLPPDNSVRANFGGMTERVVTVIIHVANKHGRDIRGWRPLPQPLAHGLAEGAR